MPFSYPRINDILNRIERNEIALPDMQREYVWIQTRSKIKDLAESLYRGYPIGIVIWWEMPSEEILPSTVIADLGADPGREPRPS